MGKIMNNNELIEYYNNLDDYARKKIDKELIDLTTAKVESRNCYEMTFVKEKVIFR